MNSCMAAAREIGAAGGGAADCPSKCSIACRWQWMPLASENHGHEAMVNEASTADVKIFPAGLDGNDSRRIWRGLAGPLERKILVA